MVLIAIAKSDLEIDNCFLVMQQLRQQLIQAEFISKIRHLENQYGYQLAYLEDRGSIKVVAGFRISESLALNKFLYVDDLITQQGDRSQGYGDAMFNWLIEYAKLNSCQQLHLDSGVQRVGAHRFYFRKRLTISSHHFSLSIN